RPTKRQILRPSLFAYFPFLPISVLDFYLLAGPGLSRGVLTTLFAFRDHLVQIGGWPNLPRPISQPRMLRDELNRVIHVPRLERKNAAELFLGFRIGASAVATLPFFQYRVNAVSAG